MDNEVIFVLVEGFADWESSFLSALIANGGYEPKEAKYTVRTMGLTKNAVKTFGGFTVLPDYDIDSMPQEYTTLILIGGKVWKDTSVEPIKRIVVDALKKNKLIGTICDASLFLGIYGFLNKINHTSNDIKDLRQYSRGRYTGEKYYFQQQVIKDGGVVTANGTAFLEFTKVILTILKVDSKENIEKFYRLYKWGQYPQ